MTLFFLGSVPVRHAEYWARIAAGRDGTGSAFDRLLTLLQSSVGGREIAILTGLIPAVAFVVLLVALRRENRPSLIAVLAAGCGCLSLGLIPQLRPAYLAPLFLAILVWETSSKRPVWLAIVVCLLWANFGQWALLGPIFAIFLVDGKSRWPVVAGCFAACFATLHPMQAIADLTSLTQARPEIFRVDGLPGMTTPLTAAFFRDNAGLNASGIVSLAIVPVALFAMVFGRHVARYRLLFPWLVAVVLGILNVNALPLAAIASAIVIGRSFNPTSQFTGDVSTGSKREYLLAFGTLMIAILIPALAWAGWLQTPPYGPRQWRVEVEPSLAESARELETMKWPGDSGSHRAFVMSPEAGDLLAWYAPGQRPTLTSLERNESVWADHASILRILTDSREIQWDETARDLLRKYDTTHLVLFHPQPIRMSRLLKVMFAIPEEFTFIQWRGRVAVFGWTDPKFPDRAPRFPAVSVDLFDASKAVPDDGPATTAREHHWLDAFDRKRIERTADRDEANLAGIIFDQLREKSIRDQPFSYEGHSLATLIGSAASPSAYWLEIPMMSHVGLIRFRTREPDPKMPFDGLGVSRVQLYQSKQLLGDPELMMRGLRAARRAIAANPDDGAAYIALGESLTRLRRFSLERNWYADLPLLGRIRAAEAAFCYRQATIRNPDSIPARGSLIEIYRELGHIDAALVQSKALADLIRRNGPNPGEEPEQYDNRLKLLDGEVDLLRKQVERSEESIKDQKFVRVVDRVKAALQVGLGQRALQILLDSDIAAFGAEGMNLELMLLLSLGEADKVRTWLADDHRGTIGSELFHGYRSQSSLIVGDYRTSLAEIGQLIDNDIATGPPSNAVIAYALTNIIATSGMKHAHVGNVIFTAERQDRDNQMMSREFNRIAGRCDLMTQRAWILFEQGKTGDAVREAEAALKAAGKLDFAGKALATYLQNLPRREIPGLPAKVR